MGLSGRMGRLRDGDSERGGLSWKEGKVFFTREGKMFFLVGKNVFLGKEEKKEKISTKRKLQYRFGKDYNRYWSFNRSSEVVPIWHFYSEINMHQSLLIGYFFCYSILHLNINRARLRLCLINLTTIKHVKSVF